MSDTSLRETIEEWGARNGYAALSPEIIELIAACDNRDETVRREGRVEGFNSARNYFSSESFWSDIRVVIRDNRIHVKGFDGVKDCAHGHILDANYGEWIPDEEWYE